MIVQPVFELDNFPAFQNDFDAVAHMDYCSIDFQIDNDDPWNRCIGIPPNDFFDILTQGLPYKPEIHVTSSADDKISIELSDEKGQYYDHRSIHLNEIRSGSMSVSHRGQNVGKTIFRNYVELGVHLELDGFIVYAADDNGAYAWARAGVPLQEETDITNHEDLRALLSERLEAVKDFIYPETYKEAKRLIKLESIYDINTIADLNDAVSDNIYFRYADGDIINDYEEGRLRQLIEFCADNKKDFTLGRYLLNGAKYQGYLNFCDEIAMPRIEKYCGGFKTIEIIYPDSQQISNNQAREQVMALRA